jgi:dihydroorotase
VPGGDLRLGAPADVTIFTDRAWTVDSARFYSLGKNTPFQGMTFPRRALATIVGGRLAMHDGVVRGKA